MTKNLTIKISATAAAIGLALSGAAHAASFIITYSGQGTSGTAYVTGTDVGGGEYDLTSGVLQSATLGAETLVLGAGVFSNSNGDNFTYDNRLFVPANAPASPDGANLTYAGGIVFHTTAPSKQDIYFSAYNPGANDSTIFYFAGYDRAYGALDTFSVMPAPAPEPATWAMMLVGIGGLGATLRNARRRGAAVLSA